MYFTAANSGGPVIFELGKRDLRFVPSPGAQTLERIRADLGGTMAGG